MKVLNYDKVKRLRKKSSRTQKYDNVRHPSITKSEQVELVAAANLLEHTLVGDSVACKNRLFALLLHW